MKLKIKEIERNKEELKMEKIRKKQEYFIVKNRDWMIMLKMLSQQEPYIYPSKEDSEKNVWSFVNDEIFQEAYELAMVLVNKNKELRKLNKIKDRIK